MFPKNDKKEQAVPKDENVRKEAQKEDEKQKFAVQPMGNEEANIALLNQLIKEANADNEIEFGGDEEPEEEIIPYKPKKGGKPLIEPGADDPNNSMYLNSSHNIVNENKIHNNLIDSRISLGGMRENNNDDNLINNRISLGGMRENNNQPVQNNILPVIQNAVQQAAEKPEFYTDPEGPDPELLDPNHPLNRDMVVEAPRLKKKGKKRKNDQPGNANNLNNINQEMQPAAGLNFNVQKLPARKEAGWFRRFLTGTAFYAGKSIGKLLNIIGNVVYVPLSWSWKKLWRSRSGNRDNDKITQEKRDHDTIPGWNGAKYEKGPGKNNDVIADFRRVPTVWSYLTAAEAEDAEGKPLPPKVGVYIRQPKEGADKDIDWTEFGHSGIGIEYSRYSRQTKRYERYSLRYGFYQAGATVSGGIMANSANVLVPGRLKDEQNVQYSVSRKFKATAKQVNDILNASETWADKGYNAATRNCTTFVKEMVRDVGHLPLGSDIFTEDHLRLSSLGNFGYFGSTASTINAGMGMESQFEKLGQEEDDSYAGYGNKRFTKQEYRQYKDTLAQGVNRITTADTPNSAVENMRRLEGPYAGTIGSYSYSGTIPRNQNKKLILTYQNVMSAINDAGQKVATQIRAITGKNHEQIMAMYRTAPDLCIIYDKLAQNALSLSLYDAQMEGVDADTLRQVRLEMDQNVDLMNKLLFDIFKNDKRIHLPILHLISLLNHGIQMVDHEYNTAQRNPEEAGELGEIRQDLSYTARSVMAGGAETMMTPSHYESYLQIYKTPDEAVRQYARYQELRRIDNDPHQSLNKAEENEYEKLVRIEKLADQFDQSHRYMLEKSSYSQQDMDYAFSLVKKERSSDAGGDLLVHSSGRAYQSLILEKIFGGMKERYLQHIQPDQARNIDEIAEWLEEDIHSCINRKKDDFTAMVRALIRNSDEKDVEFFKFEFYLMMNEQWLSQIFASGNAGTALEFGPNYITEALNRKIFDKSSRIARTLTGFFNAILAEDEIAKPDSFQKLRNKK